MYYIPGNMDLLITTITILTYTVMLMRPTTVTAMEKAITVTLFRSEKVMGHSVLNQAKYH